MTILSRLIKYTNRTPTCWLWTGATAKGYGRVSVGEGKQKYAHRVVYEAMNGPIPPGMLVCHTCDVPACVRPDHLFLGTHKDNYADMRNKGRSKAFGGAKGEAHYNSKLSAEDVLEIRRAVFSRIKNKALALKFGVCEQLISQIRKRQIWTHI